MLAGRRAGATEKTVLELTIQYELERTTEIDGRRVRQRSNVTHYGLRLHTLLERLLEEVSFSAGDLAAQHDEKPILIDAAYVNGHLGELAQDEDLSRYIL